MDSQEILRRGYSKDIKPITGTPNCYTVEFRARTLTQPRMPDGPKQVPTSPKALVEVRGDEQVVVWDIAPPATEVSLEDFTDEAKRAVAEFRKANPA